MGFKAYVFIMGLLLLSIATTAAFNTYQHENVHKQIAIYNGCTDYETNYNVFKPSTFQCFDREEGTNKEAEYMLDSTNEIVGYNVTTIIMVMFMCTMVITSAILLKDK